MPEWDAEVVVDEELVRALLGEQFPGLDASSARLLGEGWDNSVWVVEEHVGVPLPAARDRDSGRRTRAGDPAAARPAAPGADPRAAVRRCSERALPAGRSSGRLSSAAWRLQMPGSTKTHGSSSAQSSDASSECSTTASSTSTFLTTRYVAPTRRFGSAVRVRGLRTSEASRRLDASSRGRADPGAGRAAGTEHDIASSRTATSTSGTSSSRTGRSRVSSTGETCVAPTRRST